MEHPNHPLGWITLILLTTLFCLSGCGQKGPLTLPEGAFKTSLQVGD
jgi:predicted small lipoprotein YifL